MAVWASTARRLFRLLRPVVYKVCGIPSSNVFCLRDHAQQDGNNEWALPLTQYQTCLYSCIWSTDLQGQELCMSGVTRWLTDL